MRSIMIVIFLVLRVNIINLDYRFYIYLIELRVKNDMTKLTMLCHISFSFKRFIYSFIVIHLT